ncbi:MULTISPECIES: protein TolR [Denitromonas]|jgi:biopolymer transport protein TolR|uniref:Protein TolR n=2 Tax=Denitromonas TaxID=139331 RepID=A0A557SKW4_9RHOO|nr:MULTISPECIES: protein TolR [Denitromonas]TVO57706.1 protein TolR [Denitromonas halophila]TVO68019.1 protein TolR [Denitromonas ohlonensis]TVO78076.1 protein TolR [Denitromonas ohlonensis]TVT45353.1 MAG: protein TolR [Denitromonas halophila]TVT69899.1 MAG: protein TolR [Denitromonas halophila]
MRERRLMNQINVVPYIDVMLVLLVIFMVTAPMIQTGSVELPSVGKASQTPVEPLYIVVKADGSVAFRDAAQEPVPMALEAVVAQLQQMQQDNPARAVLIAGDRDARYDAVLNVMSELQKKGVDKIGLLVQRGEREPTAKR